MRRSERMSEALREVIAEIVGFELEDPRLETVTVTDVVVASDLRDAKVFVVVNGDDNDRKKALKALNKAAGYIKQQAALNLSLRHAPQLFFVRDDAEENAAKVGKILDDLTSRGEFEDRKE